MENTLLQCTRFSSLRNTKPESKVPIMQVLQEIATDKYRVQIEKIRSQENPSKSPLKDKLPLFTPTGLFDHRSIAGLVHYNGIICLDIDNIEDPESLKSKCKTLPYVYAAFITPSGHGLKVLVKTNATSETYKKVESEIALTFQNDTGAIRDNHCKDIARIQYVSYDPNIYINENSQTINNQ